MSGAELVLNATRAFKEFPVLEPPRAWPNLKEKVHGAGVAAWIMFLFWFAIYWAIDKSQTATAPLKWAVRYLLAPMLFLAGLASAATVETIHAVERTSESAHTVDVFTPILALGLEGYKVFIEFFSEMFTKAAESIAGLVWSAASRVWSIRTLRTGPLRHKGREPRV